MLVYQSELVFIHVGIMNDQKALYLNEILQGAGLDKKAIKIIWQQGEPARTIVKTCKRKKTDLLIAGVLRHESLIHYYVGSIARTLLRLAPCLVLILTEPLKIHNLSGRSLLMWTIIHLEGIFSEVDYLLANAKVPHLVRQIPLYGLAMSVISESPTSEFSVLRENMVARKLKIKKEPWYLDVDGLRIDVKIIAGKSGFEL